MRRFSRFALLLAVVAVFAAVPVGQACFMRSPQPVTVWLDHIHIDIKDGVAVKTYNCTFKNPNNNFVVGGTCYMELEPGCQVDNMSVLVDGKEMKAEILDVDKAKKVFTDIVRQGGSPALLEYYGNQLIQTQVPKIKPQGTVTVKLTYTTVMKKKGDVYRLQCLNTNPKASLNPLKSASVTVNISSKDPIKNIYSPTHKVKLVESETADISVQWKQDNYLPKHPFVLYYQVADDDVGASLIAHRELDEEGTFMLSLSPTIGNGAGKVTATDILPKDVVFCIDTSGSMINGGKMEQAREALAYCVKNLRDGDRFNIVDFSTTVRAFDEEGLVKIDEKTRAKALRYINKLAPRGGTAIQDALEESLEKLGTSNRLKMVLFATDGLPTIGQRDPEAILHQMAKKNTEDVRMFVFGEGFDVNTKLLDFLAINHRGEADYILPDEDITKKISKFFDRVGSPIMTDLRIQFEGLETKDVFPRKVADIYKGEQVVIYGRYSGSGKKKIKLKGNFKGETRTLTYEMEFPEFTEDDKNAFVPRLWAGRKVDFLLSELRKSENQDPELVKEVTYLAKRYGIVTPYTSYLMADDLVAQGNGGRGEGGFAFRALKNKLQAADAAAQPGRPLTEDEKQRSVEESRELAQIRKGIDKSGGAANLDDQVDAMLKRNPDGQMRHRSSLQALRYIGTKTFYNSKDVWYESKFDAEKHKDVTTVKVGSDEYFKLLAKDTRLAQYFALTNVTMEIEDKWYRFEAGSK